jgi:hypothetical protein
MSGPPGLIAGDVITFSARPPWWKRLLRPFGLFRPKPLRTFAVSYDVARSKRKGFDW